MAKNLDRLRRCPACYADLGVPPALDEEGYPRPPSLWLQVHGSQPGDMQWRVGLFGVDRSWASAEFQERRIRWTYRICGDGHVFLDHIRTTGARYDHEWTVNRFDVAAAIGGTAAGKSYLVLRTLSQQLTPTGLDAVDWTAGATQIHPQTSDVLEEHPLNVLVGHYARTEEEGRPMNATQLGEMMPVTFLNDTVSADLVDKIDEIQEAHAAGNEWGKRIRQPIVRRYQIGDERVLTAVADLPGELFDQRTMLADDRQRLLRNYGTLMWVVDPVVTNEFAGLLPGDEARRVMLGSMRPATDVHTDHDRVRRKRNTVQDRLARQLAELSGTLAVDLGGTQQVLVCVTKADLVRLALDNGASLLDLGRDPDADEYSGDGPGEVVKGVARYLIEVARRSSAARLVVDAGAQAVVDRVVQNRYDHTVRTQAALQLAESLVKHYDNPRALWNLVHLGHRDTVKIEAGQPSAMFPPGQIPVPSLDRHLTESLVVGQARVLRTRDLVMSALTCGIAYGLGFGEQIQQMLDQEWRELRFFLCSPLGAVPVAPTEDAVLFQPLGKGHFTDLTARSAALSQLLLCVLGRLRP
ncbi:hypothetical protein [Saccharothrix algeriensis]|uniref:Uncharacterized protein n=1 Tax=Saccharothrix algeriensis TaxID=173560 RepID=A0A8T8HX56_9PSEU|nr:hypothetical protein [Saccharothrix algeriensis]MBM7814709.1 hypothetical protein [Saccharothrix algeriensis]QTR02997.1 hypothetical protein J7S33_29065 [Saccharothrix algeriensis]